MVICFLLHILIREYRIIRRYDGDKNNAMHFSVVNEKKEWWICNLTTGKGDSANTIAAIAFAPMTLLLLLLLLLL